MYIYWKYTIHYLLNILGIHTGLGLSLGLGLDFLWIFEYGYQHRYQLLWTRNYEIKAENTGLMDKELRHRNPGRRAGGRQGNSPINNNMIKIVLAHRFIKNIEHLCLLELITFQSGLRHSKFCCCQGSPGNIG